MQRRAILSLFLLIPLLLGATYRSKNFVITAPSDQLCQQCLQVAEKARKEVALAWLGWELPQWKQPCPVKVTVTQSNGGGATSFGFGGGEPSMQMSVEGRSDKILSCVIPHEVTHTVFATYFKAPTVRWADEGAAVNSEDPEEQARHDQMVRQVLNSGRGIPLKRLFAMTEYPQDVMALYAQGYSVTNYLIGLKGRGNFINFLVGASGGYNWDQAVRVNYGFNDVNALEKAWLDHLRNSKGKTGVASQGTATLPAGGGVSGAVGTGPMVTNPPPVVSPGVTVTTLAGTDAEKIAQSLARIETKLNEFAAVKTDVEELKKRMLAAESEIARLKSQGKAVSSTNPNPNGTISDIPGWKEQRQAQVSSGPPLNKDGRSPFSPQYSQPVSAGPSSSPFVQPFPPGNFGGYTQQPYCPPGGT